MLMHNPFEHYRAPEGATEIFHPDGMMEVMDKKIISFGIDIYGKLLEKETRFRDLLDGKNGMNITFDLVEDVKNRIMSEERLEETMYMVQKVIRKTFEEAHLALEHDQPEGLQGILITNEATNSPAVFEYAVSAAISENYQ
jgi:hypothetical protein